MGGAGILPIAHHNGKMYFLFGKERNRPNESARGWADFGGGRETGESVKNAAIRECSEEIAGFLGTKQDIAKLFDKDVKIVVANQYTTFIVPIEYDKNLPIYFNNQVRFLNKYKKNVELNNTTMHEKQEIKWFTLEDMRKNRGKFRHFYREIIDNILNGFERKNLQEKEKMIW